MEPSEYEQGRGYLGSVVALGFHSSALVLDFQPAVGERLAFFDPFHQRRGGVPPVVVQTKRGLDTGTWAVLLDRFLDFSVATGDRCAQNGDL